MTGGIHLTGWRPLLNAGMQSPLPMLAEHRSLLWNFVTSDLVAGFAYLLVSISMLLMVRRDDIPCRRPFCIASAFLLLRSATYAAHAAMLLAGGTRSFWSYGLLNDATAAASVAVGAQFLGSVPEIAAFLRERRHRANLRVEKYQDVSQTMLLSAHLQGDVHKRAERMTSDDRHTDL